MRRGVLRLIFCAARNAHRCHFRTVCPGPLDFSREVVAITSSDMQASPSVFDSFGQRPQLGRNYWGTAGKGFNHCHSKSLKKYAGNYKEPCSPHGSSHFLTRQPPIEADICKVRLISLMF